jgi:hypothetical protein
VTAPTISARAANSFCSRTTLRRRARTRRLWIWKRPNACCPGTTSAC